MNASDSGNSDRLLQPGEKLGAYEIEGPIGAGAMARVFKGYDRLLARDVAIKQVAVQFSEDPVWRDRFRAEADLHKQVSTTHDNIVQVFDFIEDPRGLFLVMEYVDGSDLARALDQIPGPIETEQALRMLKQVASALVALHQAGVVHRDLKPANILLTATGRVKVVDLGLATLIDQQETLELGSTRYMAPERFGEEPIDGRADVYSLGMIAYEMLAGRAAFSDAFKAVLRDQRHQPLRWMKWHTNTRLAAPPLTTLNEAVPDVLSDLVARMMAKDPAQRIDSAESLIVTIERHFVGGQIVDIRPTETRAVPAEATARIADESPTAPLPRRNKLVITLAAICVFWVLVIGGLLYYVYVLTPQAVQQAGLDDARSTFQQARTLMQDSAFTEALPIFEDLAETWTDHPLGMASRANALICRVTLDLGQADAFLQPGQYGQAEERYMAARLLLDEAKALGYRDTDVMIQLSERIKRRNTRAQMFDDIEKRISSGDLANARARWATINDDYTHLRDLERQALTDLRVRLERAIAAAAIRQANEEADRLIAEEDLEGALARLEETEQRYSRESQAQRIQETRSLILINQALAAGKAAEDRNDRAEAMRQYERAQRQIDRGIHVDTPVAEKLAQLRSDEAFDRGQRLENQSPPDYIAALNAYRESRMFHENEKAEQAIQRLQTISARDSLIADGDAAAAVGDYAAAVRHYTGALERGADAQTQTKLSQAQVRMLVERARAELRQGELDDAGDTIREAAVIDASDREVARLRTEINVRIRYQQLLGEGDAARDRGDYGSAKNAYDSARDLVRANNIDDRQINVRLSDVEYESWVAQARSAVASEQWSQARAALHAAARIRDSEEVRRLREEVASHASKE